jgi:dolichyl-diphosphooligosaccharide--protein glycosyltransferase
VGVAAGNAAVVGLLWTWLDLGSGLDALDGVETYQLVAILAVAVVVVVPLAVPPAASATALDSGQRNGPGSVTVWQEGLSWMSDSTPDSESADLGYYGTHPQPADGDFEYPESTYGVMSWWDYGHWITIIGQRIPVANPFQQGARVASAYLQSPSERRANAILDALPSLDDEPPVSPAGNPAANTSTAELERIADEQSPQRKGEDVRYVVIDDQMAGGKFSAITRWQGPGTDAYFRQERFQLQDRNVTLPTTSDRYDRTLLSRLYYDDASDLGTYRLVHEVNRYAIVGGYATPVQRGGRRSLQRRPLTRVPLRGGWSTGNGTNAQNISRSLERARGGAVPIGRGTYVYDADVESRVKTYERVAGATLTGTAPNPNATVRAVVGLQVTNTGRQFRYSAEAQPEPDGSFSLTVPYPTEADLGPADGGTDETVVATGEYILFTGNPFAPGARGNATVPERAVLDGETITVDLEPADTDDDPGASGGNETETGGGASASGDDPQGNETTAVRPPAVVAPTGD